MTTPTTIRDSEWSEVAMPAAALMVLICGQLLIELADEVQEGSTRSLDAWLLRSLRQPDDPAVPLGPAWVRDAVQDLTALGSPAVLFITVLAVAGLMCVQRKYGLMLFTILTTFSGWLLVGVLKYFIHRDRPFIVPHLQEVTTFSFPSGHAMVSAIVYLTLGTLLMQVVSGRAAKLYCMMGAMLLTMLVGVSRIYLGVHFPTDVLAGWIGGIGWALSCWIVFRYSLRRSGHAGITP